MFVTSYFAILGVILFSLQAEASPWRHQMRSNDREGVNTMTKRSNIYGLLSSMPSHPRLILNEERISKVAEMNASDAYFNGMMTTLKNYANTAIETPVSIANAKSWSSDIRQKVATVGGMYLFTNETKYADYVSATLTTLANLTDWYPTSFLTTADISMTMALGYDWTFDQLSSETRKIIENAIIEKGLKTSTNTTLSTWASHTNNWAQVCGSGLIIASLAIGDLDNEISNEVITYAFERMNTSLEGYAPDGGWYEGYSYGTYAGIFLGLAASSLESALSDDLGISSLPGIEDLGSWLAYGYGQVGGFSWADGSWVFSNANSLWSTAYWSTQFQKPEWLQMMLSHFTRTEASNFQAFLYYNTDSVSTNLLGSAALSNQWANIAAVTHRQSWLDTESWFFGLMGGFNGRSHGHLDAGSFVVDYKQYRWAELLGSDSYSLPEYFQGSRRWTYYRCRTEGANTLAISDSTQTPLKYANQVVKANNSLLYSGSFDDSSFFGVVNLTQAYQNVTTSVLRGASLLNNSQFILRDEVLALKPVDIATSWHTAANISISSNQTAVLRQGNVTMTAKIISPSDAYFESISTNPCSIYDDCSENTNDGISNLSVRLPNLRKAANITIALAENEDSIEYWDLPLLSWYTSCTENCKKFDNIVDPYWLRNAETYF